MLDVWVETGITAGSRVVDLGCGPGYASVDLAEIVGPRGEVLAVERSVWFLDYTRAECQRRGSADVRVLEADLTGDVAFPHALEAFVTEVMATWRDAGGESDIATTLLPALSSAGFEGWV